MITNGFGHTIKEIKGAWIIVRKADKERFYACVDEIKHIINNNKILSKKDIYTIINELTVLKLGVEELEKTSQKFHRA